MLSGVTQYSDSLPLASLSVNKVEITGPRKENELLILELLTLWQLALMKITGKKKSPDTQLCPSESEI